MTWNRAAERVDAVSALMYDELMIQESRGAVPEPEAAAALLHERAMEAGVERFVDMDALDEFSCRVEFAGFDPPNGPQALRELCSRLRSFVQLKRAAPTFDVKNRCFPPRDLGWLSPRALLPKAT